MSKWRGDSQISQPELVEVFRNSQMGSAGSRWPMAHGTPIAPGHGLGGIERSFRCELNGVRSAVLLELVADA